MKRDDQSVGGEIKAAVSFMMSGITQENTQGRPRGKFMCGSGGQVRITLATKDAQMVIGGRLAEKGMVRCGFLQCLARQNVDQVGGCLQRLDPERLRRDAWNRRERTTLLMEQMMRSALPFWGEVYGQDMRR